MIESEEAKIKGRELVDKLTQKINRCTWVKDTNNTGAYIYVSKNNVSVYIHNDELLVRDKHGIKIMGYIPTTDSPTPVDNSDAYNLAKLFGEIGKRVGEEQKGLFLQLSKELEAL